MFFDAHTHTQFDAYDADRDEVVRRALDANVSFINVGTSLETSRAGMALAHKYDRYVYASVGLHPTLAVSDPFDTAVYRELATDPKILAIGECGLDYYRLDETTKHEQQKVFLGHVRLAREVGKPLMIHCRDAFPDLIALLAAHRADLNPAPGVVHFFTGTKEHMRSLLDLGFGFTFGGVVTFTRDYDEVVRYAPLTALLSETDAPYVAPVPYRGRRNEPAYVIETVKKLAELRGISAEEMAATIYGNARRIFRV